MADLWMHDHNDKYGVHFGFASSDWKNTSDGTTLTDDHATATIPMDRYNEFIYKDSISPYLYPLQNTIDNGESFDDAKVRYESSPFMTQQDGDFQHPIIAVFMGKEYIWPTRSPKDADGKILYSFQDYSNNDKGTINNRTWNIPKEGGDFTIYLDTHNINKLYKCNYYFKTSSNKNGQNKWICVENGTPYKEAQNIINNKDTSIITREGEISEGQVWWDYSINDTNNTLIGVQLKENAEVDSTLHVIVKKNLSVYSRTGYVILYGQYDQYKGMPVGETNGNGSDSIIYTINQPADNINFKTAEFYTNDNTSAKVKTDCYGPMISCGGDGWIYFKISGDSTLGARRVFGEWPCQEQDKIKLEAKNGIASIETPTYNPGTGIWTAKVIFPANVSSSSSNNYSGTITLDTSPEKAGYSEGSTIQLTAGGIYASNISATSVRTETFYVTISSSKASDDPKYTGNPSAEICYTQNGSPEIITKAPTYKYEITSNVDWAQVSPTGLVTFKANNTGSERTVTVKVTCNETNTSETKTLTQSATTPNFSGNGAYIKFYTTDTGIIETTSYGPVEGNEETNGKIYFKVFGKNENGVYFELKDKTKITSISSSTCTPDTDNTLMHNGYVFVCDIKIPTNNGKANEIKGEIKLSCMDAEYKAGSTAAVTWGGLYIEDSKNSKPLDKNHQITVTVENSLSDSCIYKQKAGDLSNDYIQSISYTFKIGGLNAKEWIDQLPTNDKPYIRWKTENTGNSIRGGKLEDISLTCICKKTTYKNGTTNTNKSITISPRQLFHRDIPQDATISSIVWKDLKFYTNEKYEIEDTIIATGGENTKSVSGIDADGGNVQLYFRIFGTVYYSDGTYQDTYYGQLSSIPAPSTNITCTIAKPNESSVDVSSSQITTSAENCYVNIVVGGTANTQVAEVANIKFMLNSYDNNGIKWNAVTWNKNGKDVSISQNAYEGPDTVKITYSASIDYIEISKTSDSNYSKFTYSNPVTFSIFGDEAITEVYYKIYIKVTKNENGNPISSTYVSYTESPDNLIITPSDKFGKASLPASATYKSSVTGAESTVEECDFSMTVEVKSGTITYNEKTLSYSSNKFENCCRIVKSKDVVIVEDWSNITFYSDSTCTKKITEMTIYSDKSSYDFWFKITGKSGSTTKTFNGDAGLISLKEHSEITDNDLSFTPSKYSTYVYKASRNISNVDEDKHVSTISCTSCDGDTSISGELKIYKKATAVQACYICFYNPSINLASMYDSWVDTNVFGSYEYGDVMSTNITTSSADVPSGTKIYIRATEKPTVKLNNEDITVNNANIVTDASTKYYYFVISANTSTTSALTYNISISCKTEQYYLNVCAKGVVTTYKITWRKAIWGQLLNDSIETGISTSTNDCYNDTEFTWQFRIKGTRKTYENEVEVSNSDTTVWLDDSSQIVLTRDTHDVNNVHLISDNITLAAGCKSTFAIYGVSEGNKLPSNISHSVDTNSRNCYITLKIKSGSSGNTSWSEKNDLIDGTFTLTQSGNTWDPYITY